MVTRDLPEAASISGFMSIANLEWQLAPGLGTYASPRCRYAPVS